MPLFLTTSLRPKQDNINIIHITDMHLFGDKDQSLLGVNTYCTFDAVMEEIEACQMNYDLLVATGDFVQDGSDEAYAIFAERCSSLSIPCVWTPGNHDKYEKIDAIFGARYLWSEKFILLGNHWLLLLLNSTVVNQAHGYLSEEEWDKFTHAVSVYPDRFILIMLHHPPFESGSEWLDQHGLKNKEELHLKISGYPNVKAIGCGHIHQPIEIQNETLFFSTPSTCVQFKPNCVQFTVAENPPGWRSLYLSPTGEVSTELHTLTSLTIQPDTALAGY